MLSVSFTCNQTFAAPDISASRMSIGNFSRVAFAAPDTFSLQREVLPLRVRREAPLMLMSDSGLVIGPERCEAPLMPILRFLFTWKFPSARNLLAPDRSISSLSVVKFPMASSLQTPVSSMLFKSVTVISAVNSSWWPVLFVFVFHSSVEANKQFALGV